MPKISEIARASNVKTNTIRRWSEEFAAYLSPNATPGPRKQREYTENDASILALVGEMRSENAPFEKIHAALASGDIGEWRPNDAELSQEKETRQEAPHALMTQLTATVAKFEGELTAVKDERDRLLQDVDVLHEKLGVARERATSAETEAAILRAHLDEMSQAGAGEQPARRWWQFWRG